MKNSLLKICICIFLIAANTSIGSLLAQNDNAPLILGNIRKIHSNVLAEDRTLLVRLPDDYSNSDKRYPVLFKLDGEKGNFLQAFSAAYYLFDMTDNAPDLIIIGIENTVRNRDLVPDQKADNFIQFIKSELLPFIDNNYRTSGFRILCGQSLSSIFTLYTFLKHPDLFNAYILSSFGLYNESLSVLFENELRSNSGLKTVGRKYIFIANGKLDHYDEDGTITKRGDKFLEFLKQSVSDSVLIKYKVYDDEGHVPFPAIFDGLKWIYSY